MAIGRQLLRSLGRADWIRFGLRDRMLRRMANPDSMPSTPFTIDFFDMAYRGDLACFLDWSVYFYGAYEKNILFFLRDVARQADRERAVFVDVGANVGQHTLFMSRHVAWVHSFEPWPWAYRKIEEKLADNGVPNVTVHRVGLSDTGGTLEYYAPVSNNTGTGSFVSGYGQNNRALTDLPVVVGDDYFHANAIDRVDIVKIDVEGFEDRVLAGLRSTVRRTRPVIVMEISGETRSRIGSRDGLHALLGDRWVSFRLDGRPHTYVLVDLDLADGDGHAVLCPEEKLDRLPRQGS